MNGKIRRELSKIMGVIISKYRPKKVILYGSAAVNKMSEGSDIDLFVIKDTKKNAWERLLDVDQYIDHSVPVDILVYTPKEIKKRLLMGDLFVEYILKHGKVLYAR